VSVVPAIIASDDRGSAGARGARALLGATLTAGLILVLAAAPLPMGAVYPWAWSVLALASAALLVLAALYTLLEPPTTAAVRGLRLPLLLAAGLVAWISFQQMPVAFPGWNASLWDQAAGALGRPIARSISVVPERSEGHLLRLFSYAAILLAAWTVARRSRGAAILLQAIACISVAYAVYGLLAYFAGNQTILWYPKWAYRYDLTGSFVNRNSFAAFLGLGLLANLGLLAQALMKHVDGRSWRILVLSSLEAIFRHGVWVILSVAFVSSALLLTHSRGGAVAAMLGAVGLVVAIFAAPSLAGPWRWAIAGLTGLGVLVMLMVAGTGLLARVPESASELGGRTEIYQGTIEAIKDHSILGTGLGSFEFVFPPYQPQSESKLIEYAHDEYLQNMLELGIPAALVFYAMLGSLVIRCFAGAVRRRRNAIFPSVAAGASVLAIAHTAIDFSTQIPAVSAAFAALLGLGLAQSVGSSGVGGSDVGPNPEAGS